MNIRITIWNEFRHEKTNPKAAEIYPKGIHEAIAAHLRTDSRLEICTATLDEPEHGLSEEVVRQTDVMLWWGHLAHDELSSLIVERVYQRQGHRIFPDEFFVFGICGGARFFPIC